MRTPRTRVCLSTLICRSQPQNLTNCMQDSERLSARFAGRHRPYLTCSTKFSRASEMHNRIRKTGFRKRLATINIGGYLWAYEVHFI